MNKREIAKAIGYMLLGSAITVALLVLWVRIMFKGGVPS
jgi:hypothetical protein